MRHHHKKKTCTKCRKTKRLSRFYKIKTGKFGRHAECIKCYNKGRREHYASLTGEQKKRLVTKQKEWRRKQWKETLLKILEYKLLHPCMDCGETDPRVLDFDHKSHKHKRDCISRMLRDGVTWKRIKREIKRCVVRCANCHRRRTGQQFGWRISDAMIDKVKKRLGVT